MVENIKKVLEAATVTEIQKICVLGYAQILRKVFSVWTEWLTRVVDALGAWFAPGRYTKRTPAKTAIIITLTIIMIIVAIKNNWNRTERSSNYGKCIFFITIKTAISLASWVHNILTTEKRRISLLVRVQTTLNHTRFVEPKEGIRA